MSPAIPVPTAIPVERPSFRYEYATDIFNHHVLLDAWLNAQAAAGYRLVSVTPSGEWLTVVMEREA